MEIFKYFCKNDVIGRSRKIFQMIITLFENSGNINQYIDPGNTLCALPTPKRPYQIGLKGHWAQTLSLERAWSFIQSKDNNFLNILIKNRVDDITCTQKMRFLSEILQRKMLTNFPSWQKPVQRQKNNARESICRLGYYGHLKNSPQIYIFHYSKINLNLWNSTKLNLLRSVLCQWACNRFVSSGQKNQTITRSLTQHSPQLILFLRWIHNLL